MLSTSAVPLLIISTLLHFSLTLQYHTEHPLRVPHTRTFFYVGLKYRTRSERETIAAGQMYVEALSPIRVSQRYPLLILPGNGERDRTSVRSKLQYVDKAGMSGTNFLNTPDGRPGWADFFLSHGFKVYIVDQPARGRSAWHEGHNGPLSAFSAERVEQRFTATKLHKLWPQASLHTQWPGNGSIGDETFDNFYASIVPTSLSSVEMAVKMKDAGSLLLDKIGPVILLTHSHSGQYSWILGDSRPAQVKAVITMEPLGPPFVNAVFPPFTESRPFGLADIALEYDPPVSSATDLQKVLFASDILHHCYRQADPPRRLKNLLAIPVLMLTSESGYHAVYDNCTADFLRLAGVQVDHVRLEDVGIHGNGHMFFMEQNNMDIAKEVVMPWLGLRGLLLGSESESSLSMRGNNEGLSDPVSYHHEL